jgi:hypothetical protein
VFCVYGIDERLRVRVCAWCSRNKLCDVWLFAKVLDFHGRTPLRTRVRRRVRRSAPGPIGAGLSQEARLREFGSPVCLSQAQGSPPSWRALWRARGFYSVADAQYRASRRESRGAIHSRRGLRESRAR